MNTAKDRPNPIPDAAIDRLVDGDLGESDRRDLLLRLEDDPDGWRRCALAFLEDQEWRKALGVSTGSTVQAGTSPVAPPGVDRPRSSARRWALAASALVATFASGLGLGGANRGREPVRVARPEVPASRPSEPSPASTPAREVGWLDLVDRSGGESPPSRVPVVSAPGLDEAWLRDRPSTVPEYVRAQWERKGYQVEERRRLVSVVLEDGRRVSIPVDEVALEYVGQPSF